MVATLKHYMNPLHIYCRLRDMRVPKEPAILVCRVYERTLFRCFPIPGNGNRAVDENGDVQKSIKDAGLKGNKTP